MISTLNIKKYLIIFILFLIITPLISVNAKNKDNTKNLVNIYFFHSKDCSHCNSEINFLDNLENKYNNIKIYRYEIHDAINNQARLDVLELYNLKGGGVPLTIIGDTPYLGYSEEFSNITFIKTIEYYSKYGYQDKVGELLKISNLPTTEIKENTPSLDQFLETYGNYHLIGSFNTNDFNLSSNTTILAILSQINPIQIITLIIIALVVHQKDKSKELIYIMSYLIISYLVTTYYIISSHLYTILTALLILIIFIFLMYYSKFKHQKYLNILILTTSCLSSIITNILYPYPLQTFKSLLLLYTPIELTQINYYINYLMTTLMTNIVYLLIYLILILKLSKTKQNT